METWTTYYDTEAITWERVEIRPAHRPKVGSMTVQGLTRAPTPEAIFRRPENGKLENKARVGIPARTPTLSPPFRHNRKGRDAIMAHSSSMPVDDPETCPICGTIETWQPVDGFESYEISSIGRARSLPRVRQVGYGRTRVVPAKILTKRRVMLRNSRVGERPVLRSVLFLEHYSRAPFGAIDVLVDGDRSHLCVRNLAWRFPELSYRSMHRKVSRIRGAASEAVCVDCAEAAFDWSYTGSGHLEVRTSAGTPYSLDPAEYEPRCRSCHRRYDEAGKYRDRDSAGRWTGRGVA